MALLAEVEVARLWAAGEASERRVLLDELERRGLPRRNVLRPSVQQHQCQRTGSGFAGTDVQ